MSARTEPDFLVDGEPVRSGSIFPELDQPAARSGQPERERILEGMVEAMGAAAPLPAPQLRALAEAALRSLEAPRRSDRGEIVPCTCGHSGFVQRDGPHAVGCPLRGL